MKPKIEIRPGDWVLLKGDTVIASDPDAAGIMKLADRLGDDDLVISKEPICRHCHYPAGFRWGAAGLAPYINHGKMTNNLITFR